MGRRGAGWDKMSKPIIASQWGLKSHPHHLCGVGKTEVSRSGEGRTRQGGVKLSSQVTIYCLKFVVKVI